MTFQKKPVVVDAVQYIGDDSFNLVRQFVGEQQPLHRLGDMKLGISTLEGVMEASPGDWIIKGVKGEFYPCKPDIFEATYSPVTDKSDEKIPSSVALEDNLEKCSVCGESVVSRCRCPRGDRCCKNGHNWHRCMIHKVRVPGQSDHGTPTFTCTCLKEKTI